MITKNFIRYTKLIIKNNSSQNYNNFNKLPIVIYLTDNNKSKNPVSIVSKLPKKSLIIIRDYSIKNRESHIKRIFKIAKSYNHYVLVAKDPILAKKTKADGIHLPEHCISKTRKYRKLFPSWIITNACHSTKSAINAYKSNADAILLSPIFATSSHPKKNAINIDIIKFISNKINIPIYALGGINNKTITNLKRSKIKGVAAIDAFELL